LSYNNLKLMQKKTNWEERLNKINTILSEVAREQRLFAKEMRQLQIAQQRLEKSQEMTDEQIRLTSKEIDKTNKEIDKLRIMVGNLTNGWGKFVEGLVEPSCVKLATSLGMKIKRVYRRVKAQVEGEEVEVDIIIEGDKNGKGTLLIVEAKSHFEPDDMQEFLGWFLRFFKFFDVYKDYEVMGAVASPRFGNGVKKRAQKEGLWVLIPSGDMMKITNPKGFKPKVLKY
jgi:hypothetical protein